MGGGFKPSFIESLASESVSTYVTLMTQVEATLETPNNDAIAAQSFQLKKRLRSIKRLRRQTLHAQANRLETLLTEIIFDVSTGFTPQTASEFPKESSKNKSICPDEHRRLVTLLEHSRLEYNALIDFIDAERSTKTRTSPSSEKKFQASLQAESAHSRTVILRPLTNDVSTLHNQIEFLEQELDTAIQASVKNVSEESSFRGQIEMLRTQLLESRHETIELRIQNADLTDQADHSTSKMTWEQRREQLMIQLESDGSTTPEKQAARNQFTEIIDASQREIGARDQLLNERDREIKELEMILTRQSTVTNGLAVGATAVAQILDADELLTAEREKLRNLQQEWEEKLRTAEIEISTERARLTREKIEFEAATRSMQLKSDEVDASKDCQRSQQEPLGRPRRWLRRLGLREE